ncbi:hypothetical protein FJ881_11495 [Escherichia albertii]|uniref:Uncharacterized protein n=2 Tax=Escherichia albertii TaxID=208962 RepID=A0ABX5HP07_ESCAL|nr:hypothetical protein [Escherichia albertii]CTV48398.1 Uncharacterised protein [Escherichia coli]EEX2835383.1 hypothetical protein [Escherichia albertii]EFB1500558.1 hypothetical protein [Escherichia albertii]EFF0798371.1 hypothetical protein [Escherichia albertii]EFO1267535.1 hypothetical protein [Escherichia albertii]
MKCISVPLTKQAMERLDYDCCKPGDLFDVVLNAADEQALAETDIITLLNATLHICIDDFEDEHVTDISKLKHMAALIEQTLITHPENSFLNTLLIQTRRALAASTGVFFYF